MTKTILKSKNKVEEYMLPDFKPIIMTNHDSGFTNKQISQQNRIEN